MKSDHEKAKNAAKLLRDFFTFSNGEHGEAQQRNLAACYLDAMARLDKATELLRAALDRSECYDEDHECGETATTRAIRAFLDERKTDDKQS